MWVLELKLKVIKDYDKLVLSLNVGKPYNYKHIINIINFIEIAHEIDNAEMLKNIIK